MKKFFSLLMFVCMMFVVVFASSSCGKEKDTIVIGFSGPLTGGAAVYGQAVQNSAKMAVDEINEKGGINGYKLSVIGLNDQHDAKYVSTNYSSLLKKGMQVSLGCVTTKPCLEFCKLSNNDHVFFLTPSATGDDVTKYENAYQMCFADTRQGTFTANYLNENVEAQKIGILYLSGDDYSEGIYNNFMAAIDKTKFTDIKVAPFTEDEPTDLSSQVNILKDCTFIFMPIYYTPASTFMTQAKGTVSNDAVYFGCDGLDGIDTSIKGFDITKIPQEVSYLSHFNSKSDKAETVDFVSKYNEKYGVETLNQFGASAYDCIYALYQALLKVEEANPGKVNPNATPEELCKELIKVFQGGFTFNGVTGTNVTWDADGYVNKAAGSYVVKEMDSKK